MMVSDWLNQNAYRAFPFVEDSSGLCTDGTTMPDWLVRDALAVVQLWWDSDRVPSTVLELVSFRIWSEDSYRRFRLSFRVNMSLPSGETLSVDCPIDLYEMDSGGVAYVSKGVHTSYGPDMLVSQVYLKVAIGTPADWGEMPDSYYDAEHVLVSPRPVLQTRCIYRPGLFGLNGIIVNRNYSTSTHGIRKLMLADGHNTTLRLQGGRIVLDIADGAGLGRECAPPDQQNRGLLTINGQYGDTNGNFSIYAGSGVSVSSGTYDSSVAGGTIPAVVISTNSVVDSYASGGVDSAWT